MGVTMGDKAELVAYQLTDVVETWYTHWRDNRVLIGGPMTWEIFKRFCLDHFFVESVGKLRWKNSSTFVNEVRVYLATP